MFKSSKGIHWAVTAEALILLGSLMFLSCGVTLIDAPESSQSGSLVNPGEPTRCFPQSGYMISNLDDGGWSYCSGVLLANGVFATAGHCAKLLLAEGKNSQTKISFDTPTGIQTVSVDNSKFKLHPDYAACAVDKLKTDQHDKQMSAVDVAFVKISNPPKGITPAQMMTAEVALSSKVLLVSSGPTFVGGPDHGITRAILGEVQDVWNGGFRVSPGIGCPGDSGGPVFTVDGYKEARGCSQNAPKLVGLASTATPCSGQSPFFNGETNMSSMSGGVGRFLQAAIDGKADKIKPSECCLNSEKTCADGTKVQCSPEGIWTSNCAERDGSGRGDRGSGGNEGGGSGGNGGGGGGHCDYAKKFDECKERQGSSPDQECEFSIESCTCGFTSVNL